MNKKLDFKTEQEIFWAGTFGCDYIDRNCDAKILASNTSLFANILSKTNSIKNMIELGANVGMNLRAIKHLLPNIDMAAVEINKIAADKLKLTKDLDVYNKSILDFSTDNKYDFVLSKGVLIHINPEALKAVYDLMYKISKKYICIVEYYNPSPVSIDYRGNKDRLFKRDFAGEILDRFKNKVFLLDYGFIYHGDNNFSGDDFTWFLLEKINLKRGVC
ncbi:MAG: pseudaminic acid biosynthesis-associated methylase [bacterium]